MINFRLVKSGVDVRPILEDIDGQPEIWGAQTGRQRITVQREARAIPIRGLRKSCIRGRSRRDVHESRFTTLSRRVPGAVSFLRDFAAEVGGELSRAKIVSLEPGHRVYLHRDRGDYYAGRDRYHLCLRSEGSLLRCGDEEVRMQPGELWWFDNKEEHEALNDTDADRIHLIFDLKPLAREAP